MNSLSTRLSGTRDWTRVGFLTEKLTGFVQGNLILGLDGTGTVWFDDVQVLPVKDGTAVTVPTWEMAPPATPAADLLVWLKTDEAAGLGVFDWSQHGHSAELRNVMWASDPVRGPCLEFDGQGMATIESAEGLNVPGGFTFALWVNPAPENAAGACILLRKYNFLGLTLGQAKAPYTIGADINGKWNLHATAPRVPASTWSHVAATYDNRTLRLYLNGKRVWEKEQVESKVNPSGFPLCVGGFWHEGRITSYGRYRGRLSDIRIFPRALAEADVGHEYERTQRRAQ